MANIRKDLLANNEHYHIFTRSIAKYVVFNNHHEYHRMIELISLNRFTDFNYRYSQFNKLKLITKQKIIQQLKYKNNKLVEIIAYCLMSTHIHLLVKQISDQGITKYMGRVLNSYSKYFNLKHKRSGPLWTSNFKNVKIETDEQLLHLTRYIHLNPTSANLVKNPKDWIFSSYLEYIRPDNKNMICNYNNLFTHSAKEYEKFCLDRKSYQQELSKIKSLLIDNYSG